MPKVKGYAATKAASGLKPFEFERRRPGEKDVLIEILYCGVCHTDIHQTRNEWGGALYPMVPGHEIVGRVAGVGKSVQRFKTGDMAGVGCFVDSDRRCGFCKKGIQQFCDNVVWTYNSPDRHLRTQTYGGYSSHIVVDEDYVLRIPPSISPEHAAPLLCAGITTYSPLRHWKVGPRQKVGIIGLGGLGHMAVKLASSMGAEVAVFSRTISKEKDARRLGADRFILTSKRSSLVPYKNTFNFLLNTISAPHELAPFIELLQPDGTMVFVGVPPKSLALNSDSLIMRRRQLAGSLIGGIPETQEMLDYCADKSILPDIEIIPIRQINQAYERMIKGEVRYRFVIDVKTLL